MDRMNTEAVRQVATRFREVYYEDLWERMPEGLTLREFYTGMAIAARFLYKDQLKEQGIPAPAVKAWVKSLDASILEFYNQTAAEEEAKGR